MIKHWQLTPLTSSKQLKKDVRAIASQQIDRLEQAMCQRRRWTAEQFRLFLVSIRWYVT